MPLASLIKKISKHSVRYTEVNTFYENIVWNDYLRKLEGNIIIFK